MTSSAVLQVSEIIVIVSMLVVSCAPSTLQNVPLISSTDTEPAIPDIKTTLPPSTPVLTPTATSQSPTVTISIEEFDIETLFANVPDLSKEAEIILSDVTGDGENDLIVFSLDKLIVFIHSRSLFVGPYYLFEDTYPLSTAAKRLTFQDWTSDGIPELILNIHHEYSLGTGLKDYWWEMKIYHCGTTGCEISWQESTDSMLMDHNFGGLCVNRGYPRSERSSSGVPMIRYFEEGFDIYGCGEMNDEEFAIKDHHRVREATIGWYAWNGNAFEFISQDIVRVASDTPSASVHKSIGSSGSLAELIIERNQAAAPQNDRCQIRYRGKLLGQVFGCKYNFSKIQWLDITGDGHEELVVQVFSGAETPGEDVPDLPCAHQRLLAYEVNETKVKEIADIYGCTYDVDLFGVKLEDYDSDGHIEILAAGYPLTSSQLDCECNEQGRIIQTGENTYETCFFAEISPSINILEWDGEQFSPQEVDIN